MNSKKEARIKQIEDEYGQEFTELLESFAIDFSYTFAMRTLGCAPGRWIEYKPIFTHYKVGKREWLTARNQDRAKRINGLTVRQIADNANVSVSTIKSRIKAGWSIPRLQLPAQPKGGVLNFGGKANKQWLEMNHSFKKANN